jgi:hypothetical protein
MLLSNQDELATCVPRDMPGICSSSTRSNHIQHYQNNMTCPHPLPRGVLLFHANPSAGFSLLSIPLTLLLLSPRYLANYSSRLSLFITPKHTDQQHGRKHWQTLERLSRLQQELQAKRPEGLRSCGSQMFVASWLPKKGFDG